MMAEVVVDVLNAALGIKENVRPATRRRAAGPSRSAPAGCRTSRSHYAFRIFGRPPRTTACDCERAMEPGLPQKLFLMTDPSMLAQDQRPSQPAQGRCSPATEDDDAVLDELFLATLSRLPNDKETGGLRRLPSRSARIARLPSPTLLWALVNTTEFIFNH